MGKKVAPEEIKRMNELYLIYNTYAGVAKEVGRAPSTVKRYIDPNYLEKKERAAAPLKEINWDSFIKKATDKKFTSVKKEKTFWLSEKPGMEGYFILQNNLPNRGIFTEKSYNLFVAEFLGISFKELIDLCIEGLGAEVNFGKNKNYPSIYFKDNTATKKFIDVVNFLAKIKLKI